MCLSSEEGGRRCANAARFQKVSTADLAPAADPQRGIPPVDWCEEPLNDLWSTFDRQVVCSALERIEEAKNSDAKITTELLEVGEAVGGRLRGLEFRVKSPASLVRKIRADVEAEIKAAQKDHSSDQVTPALVASSLKDVQRYTLTFEDHESLKQKIEGVAAEVVERGWRIEAAKNFYRKGASYKGLHMIARDSDGRVVEVQVHSDLSQTVKDRSHVLYERVRDIDAPIGQRRAALEEGSRLWDEVPIPAGLDGLTDLGGCPVVRK